MADYNPVTIEQFPELTSLLSTDQVILFTEQNGKLMPFVVELSAFGEYVLSAGALADLSEKVSQLESRYKDIEREFRNTYMTPSQVSAQYSTISNFNSQISKIEKTESFKSSLASKADDEFLEYQYNLIKNDTQRLKKTLGSDTWKTDDGTGYGYKQLAVRASLGKKEEETKK